MLTRLIRFSLQHRTILLVAAIVVLILGVRTASELPVEVLPDLTKPTVTKTLCSENQCWEISCSNILNCHSVSHFG